MVDDDVLYRFRLRLFSLAEELGNVREACRIFGIHHSTYYRWQGQVVRFGLEMFRPRERGSRACPTRRACWSSSASWPSRSVTPGSGRGGSARPAQERWGGFRISPNGVWRVLRRHGLIAPDQPPVADRGQCRAARTRAAEPRVERHIAVDHPGELVGWTASTSVA